MGTEPTACAEAGSWESPGQVGVWLDEVESEVGEQKGTKAGAGQRGVPGQELTSLCTWGRGGKGTVR